MLNTKEKSIVNTWNFRVGGGSLEIYFFVSSTSLSKLEILYSSFPFGPCFAFCFGVHLY